MLILQLSAVLVGMYRALEACLCVVGKDTFMNDNHCQWVHFGEIENSSHISRSMVVYLKSAHVENIGFCFIPHESLLTLCDMQTKKLK